MMTAVTEVVLWLSLTMELSLLVKATIVLGAALLIARFARHARASVRHLVMASSFAALIALPLLLAFAPTLTIDVPVSRVAAAAPLTAVSAPAASDAATVVATPREVFADVAIGDVLRAGWLAGAVIFLVPVAGMLWKLSTIRRTGLPVAWHRDALSHLARSRGITTPVELVQHEAVPGPMTFGLARPVIVLPIDAREWSEAELRRALLHELEHIQRGDWIMQTAARVVAACYWFHPLVWMAWRRLCLEAERSCDDAVVLSEERTDYAEQLVMLARRMSATEAQPLLGMANRSDLSARVSAVLDDRLRRGRAGFTLAAGTLAAAAVIVVTIAPVRAVIKEEPAAPLAEAEQRSRRFPAPGERRADALDMALFEAAQAGDLAGVRELLDAGANANAALAGDGSPLIAAAQSGNIRIAELLLDRGADPNLAVPGDGSALINAAKLNRLDQVALLVQRGADVNLAVDGDENPLMNAAEQGHLEMVKYLVDRGADIHARIYARTWRDGSPQGEWRTALSQARRHRRTDVVRYLESLGARN